jgi:hypothetical protein
LVTPLALSFPGVVTLEHVAAMKLPVLIDASIGRVAIRRALDHMRPRLDVFLKIVRKAGTPSEA